MQQKLDDLEQLSKLDNLIISGLEVKKSYSKVTENKEITEDASPSDMRSLEEQVGSFLQDKEIDVAHEDI